MTSKKCVFPYCQTVDTKGLFRFPKDECRRKEWLEICELTEVKEFDVICKNHFHPKFIRENPGGKILLMPGAKPTRNSNDDVFHVNSSSVDNFVVHQANHDENPTLAELVPLT